jgi:hypothetical protein
MLGFSLLHLMTGKIAITQRINPRRKALDVDFGSVPSDPATSAAISGPTRCPRDALKV